MRTVFLCCLLGLYACSHVGEPREEASSQDEAKGALDQPGFFDRMFGQAPVAEEPDLTTDEREQKKAVKKGEDGKAQP